MSATRDPTPPLIKPYAGAGANFLQRRLTWLITLAAAALCLPYGFYYALFTPWLLVPLLVPVVILAAVMIWALPDLAEVPEQTLEALLYAFFIVLFAWPNYLAIDLPGLPWITAARIVGTPMALLLVVSISTAPKFRREMGDILAASPWVWKALLVFVTLQTLSLPFSHKYGDSIARYVLAQFTQTAVFFIAAYVFRKPGRTLRWAAIFWALAMWVSAIAIVEFHLNHVPWSGHVPPLLQVQDEVVQKILAGAVRSATGQYRAASVFSTALGLSEFLALTIPFVLHFAVSSGYRPIVRMLAAASIPIILLVILYTDSRLGLLGLFLSIMLYVLYSGLQRWRRNRQTIFAPVVVLSYPAMFVTFVGLSFTVGRIKAKVWGTGQYAASNQGRIDQWHMGIPKIVSHPLGHGVGMGADALGFTNPSGVLTIDSYWLALALEYGIVGLIAYLAMFATSAYAGARIAFAAKESDRELDWLMPLSITLLVFLALKLVFAQDDSHPALFMMMGIVTALVYRARTESGTSPVQVASSDASHRYD